ncbi:MAG: oligoribonuclease, partial [Actinobacteria bacterium]|nr:oligoribonuclease [Actinomycetota bacterium]
MEPVTQNTNQRATNDRIVWIDCEMTGLSLTADALIEVAALVTDFDLFQ